MQKPSIDKLRLVYGIFLGAFTVAVGVLYIVGAAQIYLAGGGGLGAFSREIVGEKLLQFLVPSVLWIVAAVAGFVLSVLFPAMPRKKKAGDADVLRRLRRRMPLGEGEEFLSERKRFAQGELIRFLVWTFCALFCVVAAVMSAVYLFDPAHFPGVDLLADAVDMVAHVFPWFGSAFLLCCCAVGADLIYARRALPRMKRLIALGKGAPIEPPSALTVKYNAAAAALGAKRSLLAVRIAVAAVGVVFVGLGIANGGMTDVLNTAVMLCRSCIGLG